MGEEDGFLDAIAEDPDDLVTQLVYADWLEECERERDAACLRRWCELVSVPYDEATYRILQSALEGYRAKLLVADPTWVRRVATARDWADVRLAENVARLHLRTRHGRKADRQWFDPPRGPFAYDSHAWYVYYWRNPPTPGKEDFRRGRSRLRVDRITAEVQEPDWRISVGSSLLAMP